MKIVMISGHFDPLHDAHVDYIEQAMKHGDFMYCVVSSDKQLMKKKGDVNIPEKGRAHILDLVLSGLNMSHEVILNIYDTETTLVAEALRKCKPDIFCRAGDKTIEDMPLDELAACNDLGIKVVHAEFRINRHGSGMLL